MLMKKSSLPNYRGEGNGRSKEINSLKISQLNNATGREREKSSTPSRTLNVDENTAA